MSRLSSIISSGRFAELSPAICVTCSHPSYYHSTSFTLILTHIWLHVTLKFNNRVFRKTVDYLFIFFAPDFIDIVNFFWNLQNIINFINVKKNVPQPHKCRLFCWSLRMILDIKLTSAPDVYVIRGQVNLRGWMDFIHDSSLNTKQVGRLMWRRPTD